LTSTPIDSLCHDTISTQLDGADYSLVTEGRDVFDICTSLEVMLYKRSK